MFNCIKQKLFAIFAFFPIKFNFVKSKIAAILAAILNDDVMAPYIYLSCRGHHRPSIGGKMFSIYCNTANTQGRGCNHTHPPSPPVPWGYKFACTSEG